MLKKTYIFFLRLIIVPIPTKIGALIRYIFYKPIFKRSNGIFYIAENVDINGYENIEIGKKFYAAANSKIYAKNSTLKIGNNFGMNYNSQLGAADGKIVIGDNCAIGPNCVLRAADHEFSNPAIPFNQQGHRYGEIIIENDVWIASNCVITSNTTIGTGSVIGAGSVVTKDVEPFSLMGGVPAKLIKKRV